MSARSLLMIAMLGCGATEEVCVENVEACYEECGADEACLVECEEEYDACMESVDREDAAVGILEFLGLLFGSDDEEE